ncbi:cadherin domain-containing protein [Microvirga sp. CF3062]|uniref:cadherin domain-containing protein n=1 Tax=Microvirga sp. CF3062 TaxID=3110182 RepID=UPI002E7620E6|nr:cadherin domain-containing protein [Microvirga sp. CF3062]MEE1656947.1 cadherin domain-containing protein [Microvirga sp. CF3062]
MVQVVKWGSETSVSNSGTFLSSTSAVSSQTSNVVRAYVSLTDNSVWIRVHDFLGTPINSADQWVGSGGLAENSPNPILTALSDGRFLLAWDEKSPIQTEVKGQLIGADGKLIGSSFVIPQTTSSPHSLTDVSALANGGFAVTWRGASGNSVSTFDADLWHTGNDFSLGAGFKAQPGTAQLVTLTNGSVVAAYRNYMPGSRDIEPFYGITLNIMDNMGRQASAPLNVLSSEGPVANISISALLFDRFVVTWSTDSGEFRGQIFSGTGSPVLGGFTISTTGLGQQSDPATTVLPDGRFVVTWVDSSSTGGDASGTSIRAQVFYADGRKDGAEFLVNTSTVSDQLDPSIVAFADGRFAISWTDMAGDTSGTSIIRSQVFDPRGDGGVFHWSGTDKADTFAGRAGDDTLHGLKGNDVLSGEGGNDQLFDGYGLDTLLGGSGDDILIASTLIYDAGYVDILDGGEGFDIAQSEHQGNWFVVDLKTGNNNINMKLISIEGFIGGPTSNDRISGSDIGNDLRGRGGNDTLTGLLGNDTLDGGDQDDSLDGGDGTDLLLGGAGNDVLTGSAGSDNMEGGLGDDAYYVDASDIMVESADAGKDTVYASISYNISNFDNLELLTGIGAGDIALTGNGIDNIIKGNAGNNRLDGGDGFDTLIGGGGNDTYIIRDSYTDGYRTYVCDTIQERSYYDGIDTVLTEWGGDLPDNVENMIALSPSSTFAMHLSGNQLANHLVGNAGDNRLDGGDIENTDADTLEGGKGNDTYYLKPSQNSIIVEKLGEGLDTLFIHASYALGEGIGIDVIRPYSIFGRGIKIVGNSYRQTLEGTSSSDVLDGGGGSDTLVGGSGDDTYHVHSLDDVVVEAYDNGHFGIDTIIADLDYTLSSAVSVEIVRAEAEAGSLSLAGNSNANTLIGNNSGNTLAGGGGLDTLKGGEGDDRFEVDNDDVVEDAGGRDTLVVTVSGVYTLASGIENAATRGGVDGIHLTGNVGANILSGSSLSNTLSGAGGDDDLRGRDGNDVLEGGEGEDSLDGGAGADRMIGGAGIDTAEYQSAKTNVTVSLEDPNKNSGEAAGDTFSSIENIVGSDYADMLIGSNGAANILSGGLGDDTLIGMGGNDVLKGGNGQNTAVYEGSFSSYEIVTLANGSLQITDNIKARGGVDILVDIQELKFADLKFRTANREPTELALSSSSINENILASTIVATFSAYDNDGDDILYTLESTDGPFRIDGNNLVLTGALDFESKAQHSITIKAWNGYGEGLTSTFTLTIADVVEATSQTLRGTSGVDRLTGEAGNDVLHGHAGNDVLQGEAGNDKLYGSSGQDVLSGGLGQDIFVFDTKLSNTFKINKANQDKITDFKVVDDTVHLAKSVFKTLDKKGVLKSAEFYQGTKAHDRDDNLIYNKKTGALYYDADGTGSQAQIQIATLSKNLKMTHKDFFVV